MSDQSYKPPVQSDGRVDLATMYAPRDYFARQSIPMLVNGVETRVSAADVAAFVFGPDGPGEQTDDRWEALEEATTIDARTELLFVLLDYVYVTLNEVGERNG